MERKGFKSLGRILLSERVRKIFSEGEKERFSGRERERFSGRERESFIESGLRDPPSGNVK